MTDQNPHGSGDMCRRFAVPALVAVYLAGLIISPGFLWHRMGFKELDDSKGVLTVYAVMIWPIAVPLAAGIKLAMATFAWWQPHPPAKATEPPKP